ncbi:MULTISPECIES: STAS/SEC14 domain-containing protein [Shewanella]|uniref:STAS/SEC14 domain-containing protein n=1 Tax=Shewanella marisflavi TaxID=260364 RepID=A0ABX5WJ77_9GAMM|nr:MULTISPECIES: STAS/SEC14 domain-containing protein [Shewanella]QDF74347.1 STAS/SEC14 domain-containing protein [Shewanella marisflavi]
MSAELHGIAIGIERNQENVYLTFKAVGKLTHQDYLQMTPLLESALAGVESPEILALIDITELDGISLHGAWDDLKLGIKHGKEFKRVAIVGEGDVQQWMTRVANWFTSGEFKFFEDKKSALAWLF